VCTFRWEVQVDQLDRDFVAFAGESAEWAEFGWGAALETWPDPETDWAGRGFTVRNEESST
jgi:hypothetical protein